jgi:hypothetical protein
MDVFVSLIKYTLSYTAAKTAILILPSHLYLCFPSGLSPSGFPTRRLSAACYTHLIPLDLYAL